LTKLPFLVKKNKLLAQVLGMSWQIDRRWTNQLCWKVLRAPKTKKNYKCQQSIVCLCGEVW